MMALALNSCNPPPAGQGFITGAAGDPSITRTRPKIPDPVKIENCSRAKRGQTCEQDEDCKEICDNVFSSRGDKKTCYEFSQGLVSRFKDLLESTEDGDVEDIDPFVLECLLNIDEREFAKAVKDMNRKKSEDFLIAVSNNEALAQVLNDEDDEFNILKQLLNKATGSNDLLPQLKKEIETGKSFLYLSAEGAESSWAWLDSYVGSVCDNSNDCFEGETISAYCKALVELNDRDLEDFLSDGTNFAQEYERDVKGDDYLYEVDSNPKSQYKGDFRDWCQGWARCEETSGPCPSAGTCLPDDKKLADITLAPGRHYDTENDNRYAHEYDCAAPYEPIGSSDPDQTILLRITDRYGHGRLFLNDDEIDYDESKTYYLYIDEKRYELGDYTMSRHNNNNRCIDNNPLDGISVLIFHGLLGDSGGFENRATLEIWLAEEEDGECFYHTP